MDQDTGGILCRAAAAANKAPRPWTGASRAWVDAKVDRARRAYDATNALIEARAKKAEDRAAAYGAVVQAADTREALFQDLNEISARCTARFAETLAANDATHALAKTNLRLTTDRLDSATSTLPWLEAAHGAQYAARAQGHNEATRWRAAVKRNCAEFEAVVRRECGLEQTDELVVALRRLQRDLNACSAASVVKELERLERRSLELAAQKDPDLKKLDDERLGALERFEASSAVSTTRRVANALDAPLRDEYEVTRDAYEASAAVLQAKRDAWTKVSVESLRRRASPGPKKKTTERPATTSPAWRPSSNSPRSIHRSLLRGDDSTFVRLFDETVGKAEAAPVSDQTLRAMFKACKRTLDTERALSLLDDVEKWRPSNIEWFNAALAVCAAAHAWRRALTLFTRLQTAGLKPTTHTYSLVLAAAAAARAGSVEVYEGLKFAGVPEYLAYTAAVVHAIAWRVDSPLDPAGAEATIRGLGKSQSAPGLSALDYPPPIRVKPRQAIKANGPGSPYRALRSFHRLEARRQHKHRAAHSAFDRRGLLAESPPRMPHY